MPRAIGLGVALCGLLLLAGCSFDEGANGARGCDSTCAPGMCFMGYCLSDNGAVSGGVQGGTSGNGMSGGAGLNGGGAGTPVGGAGVGGVGAPGGECSADEVCYLGPAGTRGVGACRDGSARCEGGTLQACVGQMLPTTESCNALDDDCNGTVDDGVELGSCEGSGMGACTSGVMVCSDGVATCQVGAGPSTEVCNGLDDDCDGTVDNDTNVACFPDGMVGCSPDGAGGFLCTGLCAAGMRSCRSGQLTACLGYVAPIAEVCGGDEARDENCDGHVDDHCPCSGVESQRCYDGPAFTAGIGICRAGMQHCQNGAFGDCEGSVVPGTERCSNQGTDDDCDRVRDDVFGLGLFCVDFAKQGLCFAGELACVGGQALCDTPAPAATETACDGQDEDCDGPIDEVFVFATDEAHCGNCETHCATGDICCGGVCHDPDSDALNCGRCGNACGDSTACCGGSCVGTGTALHCGGCGACGPGQACCGGGCVATNTVNHCGGCGACGPGQACCGGSCVDTDSDDHCGGCGACGPGQACCGGGCVDTDTNDHCGGCGGCASGQACCDGGCVPTGTSEHCAGCTGCELGETCCDSSCVDTSSNGDHCGGCRFDCGDSCSCVGGECQDPGGAVCL